MRLACMLNLDVDRCLWSQRPRAWGATRQTSKGPHNTAPWGDATCSSWARGGERKREEGYVFTYKIGRAEKRGREGKRERTRSATAAAVRRVPRRSVPAMATQARSVTPAAASRGLTRLTPVTARSPTAAMTATRTHSATATLARRGLHRSATEMAIRPRSATPAAASRGLIRLAQVMVQNPTAATIETDHGMTV